MTKRLRQEAIDLIGLDASDLAGMSKPQAMGPYEGADRMDRKNAMWQPRLRSADSEMQEAKGVGDARSRDAYRNDAFMLGGLNYSRDSIVGSMYLLNSKPNATVLGLDEKWAEEFSTEVEAKFMLWAESTSNWVDASRRNTLTGLIRLAIGIYGVSGEFMAMAQWLRDGGSQRPFKTAIQVMDLDRVCNPHGKMNDKYLRNGVVVNNFGAPQGYWIRDGHPSDVYSNPWQWTYAPATKPWGRQQVIHIAETTRPDQSRGISDLVSALSVYKMTHDFRAVTLQKAAVEATVAATVESELPTEVVLAMLGGAGGNSDAMADAISTYGNNYLGLINEYAGSAKNLVLDGVRIPHLYPGTKLNLQPAGKGGPLGSDFENSLLRYLSSALGISYEEFSNDYSKSNYSSIRAAMQKTWKTMQSRKRMIADRFANHIFTLWLEEAINAGEITSLPKSAPSFYDGLNKEAYSTCEWVGAGRGQIDELKETQAAVLRIKEGLSTREEELGRLGKDWRKSLLQMKREQDEIKRLGIEFAGDSNTTNALAGANDPNAAEPDGGNDGNSGQTDNNGN